MTEFKFKIDAFTVNGESARIEEYFTNENIKYSKITIGLYDSYEMILDIDRWIKVSNDLNLRVDTINCSPRY